MAAPTKVLEAFVKLFADDAELRKSFAGLPGAARKAGDAAGLSFSEGLNRSITQQAVTPGRAGGARPLQLPRVGGREVDLSSPFSRGFQQFRTARELADLTGGGPGGIVPGGGGPGAGGGRGGGLLGRGGGLGGGLGQISQAAGLGGIGARIGLLANPATAVPAAVIGSLTLYATGVKAAMDAERELSQARTAGDLGAVTGIFEKSSAAVRDYDADVLAATDTTVGLEAGTRRVIAGAAIAWAELSGRGIKQLTKEAEAAKKAATEMWRAFGAPKLAVEAMKREAQELAAIGQASLKAAADSFTYSKAIDQLVAAKERDTAASKKLIDAEIAKIQVDEKLSDPERVAKIADARERQAALDRGLARERTELDQQRRRQFAEMDATEEDHTASIEQQQRQRRDAIVEALGQVIEAEASANASLEKAFNLRTAFQREQTGNAIKDLERETAARRRALELRIGGAQGQERVQLERELTLVTEEETTKRTQIDVDAAEQRIRLVRATQAEIRAQQEAVFAIQRTLGQRSLQDDLSRFAATARAAEAGSKTQLDALAKVAGQVKALADQARAFLGEALSASDRLAQAEGRDPSEFVSLAGLAQDAAAEQARLEEAQRTLEFGGQISRTDFSALQSGALDQLRRQAGAGRSVSARELAAASVGRGESLDTFSAGLRGAAGRPQDLFGAQLGAAFEEPGSRFRDLAGALIDPFERLASAADVQLTQLEARVDQAFSTIEQRAQRAGGIIQTRLIEMTKRAIATELDRDEKLY